jgi:hypothetical protein
MNPFVMLPVAVLVGYAIPVVLTLVFSLMAGRLAPAAIAHGGRIRGGFVVAFAFVWTLAAVAAGYAASYLSPEFSFIACGLVAVSLITTLWSNFDEMKKRQSLLRMAGMTLGTLAGTALGFLLFRRG